MEDYLYDTTVDIKERIEKAELELLIRKRTSTTDSDNENRIKEIEKLLPVFRNNRKLKSLK